LALDDPGFREVFAGSPIKRIGRNRMVRNCLVAAGNSGAAALTGPVVRLLDDDAPVVRGAAIWALGRLDPRRWEAEHAIRRADERDETVLAEWSAGPGERAL
jgi:epoxyqueuosine reductase